jgi:hypothetical protein
MFRKPIHKYSHGQLPITVLVVGVLLVCAVALLSFVYFDARFKQSFIGINLAEQVRSDVEQFHAYRNLKYSCEDAAKLIDAEYRDGKVFIAVEIKKAQGIFPRKEIVLVNIKHNFAPSECQ